VENKVELSQPDVGGRNSKVQSLNKNLLIVPFDEVGKWCFSDDHCVL